MVLSTPQIQIEAPPFTAKVLQQTMTALDIRWRFHTPWQPQRSGKVEQMNQTLKSVLSKLLLETKLNCIKCLPLALLRIRTKPRPDMGVSPYETMFGLPFLTTMIHHSGSYEEGKRGIRTSIQTIAKTLEDLRKKGYLPQRTSIDFKIHPFQPGDWVLIRIWKETPLTSKREGPFQVLLTTETAVRAQEKGWTHFIKGPVPEPTEWTVVDRADTKITLRKRPHHHN